MKKITFLFLALVYLANNAIGQSNPKVFSSSTIVWAGIDFSKTKLIGSEGFSDPEAIANEYFDKWNQLILAENKKYDIAKAYHKDKLIHELSVSNEQNTTQDPAKLVINETYKFRDDEIENIIKNYSTLKETEGLGLVYIVEYFSKLDTQGSIYVVFFDLANQDILHKKKYLTKAKGFGIRNYWANTFYETIKESGKEYKKAAKSFGK